MTLIKKISIFTIAWCVGFRTLLVFLVLPQFNIDIDLLTAFMVSFIIESVMLGSLFIACKLAGNIIDKNEV